MRQNKKTAKLLQNPKEYMRDPYILDFLDLPSKYLAESDLEKGLVARQQRIRTEDEDFYIDLVFYNFKLKCFLLIDIKMGKLTNQDVGQMDTYIRIYDKHQKDIDDNPPIGLILCSQKSEAIVKYSVLTDS